MIWKCKPQNPFPFGHVVSLKQNKPQDKTGFGVMELVRHSHTRPDRGLGDCTKTLELKTRRCTEYYGLCEIFVAARKIMFRAIQIMEALLHFRGKFKVFTGTTCYFELRFCGVVS